MTKQVVDLGTVIANGSDGDTAREAFTKVNANFTEVYDNVQAATQSVNNKVDKVVGKSLVDDTEITKLSTVAANATQNSVDSFLLDRSNHTGTQATSTITGLEAELATFEKTLTQGSGITIDRTNPEAPVISAAGGSGLGDVVGPAASVNNNIAVFDGVTGKIVKDGGTLGTAAFTESSAYATAAQGTKAETAVQPAALDAYTPTTGLGSAAFAESSSFATPVDLDTVESSLQSYVDTQISMTSTNLAEQAGSGAVGFSVSENYPQTTVGARLKGVVTVEMFGVSPSNPDNTTAYNNLIAAVPSGTLVRWGQPGATYIGNFISPTKSLQLDLNGAVLRDFSNNFPVIAIGSLTNVIAYSVVETTLAYGSVSFQVVGASGLFSVGDIGYLWDSATRPSDSQPVNYEVIKIKSVSGNIITVEGFLASHKGAGAIKFYYDPNQLKGAKIFGGIISPSASHITIGAAVFNCEDVTVHQIQTRGTTGDAISVRSCYNIDIFDITSERPTGVGSGQGYGVSLLAVSQFCVENILGHGMRHVYDQDSAYFGKIVNITDMDDRSACITLAHNGFTGHIELSCVNTKTVQYPVILSSQGYDGTTPAVRGNHPFRNIRIKGINTTIDASVSPNSSGIFGVYFQNSVIDSSVEDVSCNVLSSEALIPSAGSSIVRVDGIAKGTFEISRLSANKVGRAVFSSGNRGTLAPDGCITVVSNVHVGACAMISLLQGSWAASYNNIVSDTAPVYGQLFAMDTVGSNPPRGIYVGQGVSYGGPDIPLVTTSAFMTYGSLPYNSRAIGSSVAVVAGQAITQAEVQNKSTRLVLSGPSGTGTTTLSATAALPPPVVGGQELYIMTLTGQHSLVFPAGTNLQFSLTIAPGEQVRLIGISGRWTLLSRTSSV